MSTKDEVEVREALAKEGLRKRYPDRPKVRGEHSAVWKWVKKEPFKGKLAGSKHTLYLHRHRKMSFPESAFARLEELGFEFVQWCTP